MITDFLLRQKITELEAKVEELEAKVLWLSSTDEFTEEEWRGFHGMLSLTRTEARFLRLIMRRPLLTKEAAYTAIYEFVEKDSKSEEPTKILDVFMCKIRTKLKRADISVETVWGRGWMLSEKGRRDLEAIIHPQQAAA